MRSAVFLATTLLLSTSGFAEPIGSVSNDGEIANVLLTINEGEIDAAKLELKNGKATDARSFAKTMIDQHEKNKKDTKKLAKAKSLTLKDSDLSKSLKTDAKSNNADLKKADKAAFDQAYLKQQIQMHEGALKVIDEKLLPKVEGAELRTHLENTRTAVTTHLSHAKDLVGKF